MKKSSYDRLKDKFKILKKNEIQIPDDKVIKRLIRQSCIILAGLVIFSITLNLVSNQYGKDVAKIANVWNHIPVMILLTIFSAWITKSQGKTQSGRAWKYHTIFIGTWLAAQIAWSWLSIIDNQPPFPSIADGFYIVGYFFYGLFLWTWIQPFRKTITKKVRKFAVLSTLGFLAVPFIILLVILRDPTMPVLNTDLVLGMTYPILDAILVLPTFLCMVVFLKSRLEFPMIMFSANIGFQAILDNVFFYLTQNNSFYDGHPIEIPFLLSYDVLLAAAWFFVMRVRASGSISV